jgi:RNA polymerase sigma-70 factor, ECF subfamily
MTRTVSASSAAWPGTAKASVTDSPLRRLSRHPVMLRSVEAEDQPQRDVPAVRSIALPDLDDGRPRTQASSVNAEDPDGDIVRLIKAGELDAALRSLMRRHGTAVYRYCRGALRDPMLVDDVHQQIFIEAHRDLARFAGRSTLRIWLFTIARHRVIDAARWRRRALAHIDDRSPTDVPDPSPTPGEQIDDAHLQQALVACLGELGEDLRAAVLLRYQQGLTFEDMARICDEKPGTLQARVGRALVKLREDIEARTGGQL